MDSQYADSKSARVGVRRFLRDFSRQRPGTRTEYRSRGSRSNTFSTRAADEQRRRRQKDTQIDAIVVAVIGERGVVGRIAGVRRTVSVMERDRL